MIQKLWICHPLLRSDDWQAPVMCIMDFFFPNTRSLMGVQQCGALSITTAVLSASARVQLCNSTSTGAWSDRRAENPRCPPCVFAAPSGTLCMRYLVKCRTEWKTFQLAQHRSRRDWMKRPIISERKSAVVVEESDKLSSSLDAALFKQPLAVPN